MGNQKFCERKQFAQGHLTSQCQSWELNVLKGNGCFYSESLRRAPSSWCQEFPPGGTWELQWPSWNSTLWLREKRLRFFISGTRVPQADQNPLSELSMKMLFTSLSNREQDKMLPSKDENVLYSVLQFIFYLFDKCFISVTCKHKFIHVDPVYIHTCTNPVYVSYKNFNIKSIKKFYKTIGNKQWNLEAKLLTMYHFY